MDGKGNRLAIKFFSSCHPGCFVDGKITQAIGAIQFRSLDTQCMGLTKMLPRVGWLHRSFASGKLPDRRRLEEVTVQDIPVMGNIEFRETHQERLKLCDIPLETPV